MAYVATFGHHASFKSRSSVATLRLKASCRFEELPRLQRMGGTMGFKGTSLLGPTIRSSSSTCLTWDHAIFETLWNLPTSHVI